MLIAFHVIIIRIFCLYLLGSVICRVKIQVDLNFQGNAMFWLIIKFNLQQFIVHKLIDSFASAATSSSLLASSLCRHRYHLPNHRQYLQQPQVVWIDIHEWIIPPHKSEHHITSMHSYHDMKSNWIFII